MDIFPIGFKGLMLVGILAALMSTADICILTAAANGSRDIYQRYANPDAAPNTMFRLSMTLAAVIGIAASLMAWQLQDVVGILLIAFTINAAALFVPTVALVFFKNASTTAAFWSMSLALTTVIGWYVAASFKLAPVFEIDPLSPGLSVSTGTFGLLSLINKQHA